MTVPTERDDIVDAEPDSSAKQFTGRGLSPAVEKMFGALVHEPATAEAQSSSTPDTWSVARSGTADP